MDSRKLQMFLGVAVFAFAAVLSAARLDPANLGKLDPRFHAVVSSGTAASILPRSIQSSTTSRDGSIEYGAIVYTEAPEAIRSLGVPVHSVFNQFVTVRATAGQLARLAQSNSVRYIDAGEIQYPMNDIALGLTGADLVHAGFANETAYTGENVLVCIIDTGIDWDHPDFCDPADPTQSRILYIWDQTLEPVSGESSPSETGADYGVEYTQAQIEDELDGSPAGFVRERDYYGHGTHVAGTTAGNGASLSTTRYKGMAYEANLIIVKAGNGTFLETDVVNALSYARQKAEALGRPIVVNMSLGSDAGPHDDSGAKATAINEFSSSGNGRVVVVSAGNSGSENIHLSQSIAAGSYLDIAITVPSYTAQSSANNDDFDFEIWAEDGAGFTARMTSPNGESVTQAADGATINDTEDGTIYIYNYVSSVNDDRQIRVSVYDRLSTVPPASGVWTLRLTNPTSGTITFHGWLFDRTIGSESAALTLDGGDPYYTLGNTASSAVIVGSHVSKWRWHASSGSNYSYTGTDRSDDISDFSSIGPTRDEREKPDLSAPGQAIGSCLSSDASYSSSRILPGGYHVINQGTSMSAPIVTGAAAIILQLDPTATADEVLDWLSLNARTDSYTGTVWNARWGYGKLDIYRSLMKAVNASSDPGREICVYDQWNNNYGYTLSAGVKAAVRFTPSLDGEVMGVFIHTSGTVTITDPLQIEIWSDNSGSPDQKLGETLSYPAENLVPYTWNFIPLHDQGQALTSGQSYHVVIYHNSTGYSLGLLMENGLISYRSKLNTGSGWLQHTYDFRIRPVIVKTAQVIVAAKAFLEGPYSSTTHLMNTTLASDSVIPTTSPYSEDARTAGTIPSDAVDWVLLQLRSSADGTAVASRSLFLRSDGRLMDTDGTTVEIPLDVSEGSYYLIVKHRNHLGVMSASAQPLSTSASVFDFSVLSNLYGGSAKLLETGVYGMFAGDANADGQIKVDDKNSYWWIQVGQAGYKSGDFNLDGQVKVDDKNAYWWLNVGRGSQIP